MYSKMFELIDKELNSLKDNTLELKKIEIKGIKVKLVFFDKNDMKVKTIRYEMDWFGPEPKLKFRKVHVKPFNDKYFR